MQVIAEPTLKPCVSDASNVLSPSTVVVENDSNQQSALQLKNDIDSIEQLVIEREV